MTKKDLDAEQEAALAAMQADDTPVETEEVEDAPEEEAEEQRAADEEAEGTPAEASEKSEEEPEVDPKSGKPSEYNVPSWRLREEADKRREAEAELAKLREQLSGPKEEEKAVDDDMPDAITEPEKFREWVNGKLSGLAGKQNEFSEAQKQQQTLRERAMRASALEQEFASKTDDYGPAVEFLREQRVAELTALGWDEQTIPQIIAQDANAIFDNAMKIGKNPAALLYEQARLRGWKKMPEPQKYAEKDAETQAREMRAKKEAQENTGSLSSAAGGAAEGDLTVETLAKMSDDEIKAMMKGGKPSARMAKALGA